jgi:hypothetical protein
LSPGEDMFRVSELQSRTNLLDMDQQLDHLFLSLTRAESIGLASLAAAITDCLPAAAPHLQLLATLLHRMPVLYAFVSNLRVDSKPLKEKVPASSWLALLPEYSSFPTALFVLALEYSQAPFMAVLD